MMPSREPSRRPTFMRYIRNSTLIPRFGAFKHRTSTNVTYLEIGDWTSGDEVAYPADDIQAVMGPNGKWLFSHKDGRSY